MDGWMDGGREQWSEREWVRANFEEYGSESSMPSTILTQLLRWAQEIDHVCDCNVEFAAPIPENDVE